MKTTSGTEIKERYNRCDCNSTCGCPKCNPDLFKPISETFGIEYIKQKPKEPVKCILNKTPSTGKPKELDWEKEFEIKYGRNSGRLTFYNEQKYYWNNKFYDEVKDFISQILTQQRTELLEEILEENFCDLDGTYDYDGIAQDVIDLIQK